MRKLVLFAMVGVLAQLIDGALGMAYGLTSTTLLVAVGTAPAVASATVHLAELGTTAVSGVSHWRFGNVDWRTVRWMTFPGARRPSPGRAAAGRRPGPVPPAPGRGPGRPAGARAGRRLTPPVDQGRYQRRSPPSRYGRGWSWSW